MASLWVTNWTGGYIELIEVDDVGIQDRQTIFNGFVTLNQAELDKNTDKLYWSADKKIYRGNVDDDFTEITKSGSQIRGIVLDTDNYKIYYTTVGSRTGEARLSDGQIRVVNYDGSDDHAIVTELSRPVAITLDSSGTVVLWIDANEIDGSTTIQALDIVNEVRWNLPLDGLFGSIKAYRGRLYYSVKGAENAGIWSCNFLGQDARPEFIDQRGIYLGIRHFDINNDEFYFVTEDGPETQWFTPPTTTGVLTGIGYGIGYAKAGQLEWVHYLSTKNSELGDDIEPDDAINDLVLLIEGVVDESPVPTDKLVIIDANKKNIYDVTISGNWPIDIDSNDVHRLLDGDISKNVRGVCIDSRKVKVGTELTNYAYYCEGAFWNNPVANQIRRVDLGGDFSTEIANIRTYVADIQIDEENDKIYSLTDTEIIRSDIDGSHKEVLLDAGVGYTDMTSCYWDSDSNSLYWTARRANEWGIYKGSQDGDSWVVSPIYSTSKFLASYINYAKPTGVFVDSVLGIAYWCDGIYNGIYRMNPDGTGIVKIDLSGHVPRYIKFGKLSRTIYWSEPSGIYNSGLDGSNVRLVISSSLSPLSASIFATRFDVFE